MEYFDRREPFTVEEVLLPEGSFLFHGAADDLWMNNHRVRGFYEKEVDGEIVYYHSHPESETHKGRMLPAAWDHKLDQVIRLSEDPSYTYLRIHCHKITPGEFHYSRFPVGLMITSGLVMTTGPTDMQPDEEDPYKQVDHIFGRPKKYPFEYDPRISAKEAVQSNDGYYDAGVQDPIPGDVVVLIEHSWTGKYAYSRDRIEAFAKKWNRKIIEVNNKGEIIG